MTPDDALFEADISERERERERERGGAACNNITMLEPLKV